MKQKISIIIVKFSSILFSVTLFSCHPNKDKAYQQVEMVDEIKVNTQMSEGNRVNTANNKFQMSEKISDYVKRVDSGNKTVEQIEKNRRYSELADRKMRAAVDNNSIRPNSIEVNAHRYVDLNSKQQRKLRDSGIETGWGDTSSDIEKKLKQK